MISESNQHEYHFSDADHSELSWKYEEAEWRFECCDVCEDLKAEKLLSVLSFKTQQHHCSKLDNSNEKCENDDWIEQQQRLRNGQNDSFWEMWIWQWVAVLCVFLTLVMITCLAACPFFLLLAHFSLAVFP